MNKRLYVGNLPYKIDEATLETLFSQAGAVASVHVMREAESGRARGFGFVEMVNEQGAAQAIKLFHNYQLDGRALTVKRSPSESGARRPIVAASTSSSRGLCARAAAQFPSIFLNS